MFRTSTFFLQRRTGVCAEWTVAKGFGFITDHADQKRLFAHATNITGKSVKPYKALTVGENVEFELAPDRHGRRVCVRIAGLDGVPLEGTDTVPLTRETRNSPK